MSRYEEAMTVDDLVKYLQTLQADMLIAYQCYSEQCLMRADEIKVTDLCEPRADGWIQNERPDMPTRRYLLFPGN
jgi:hypothetical protein